MFSFHAPAGSCDAGRAGGPRRRGGLLLVVALGLGLASLVASGAAAEEDFTVTLARVDHALKTNPNGVSEMALRSCLKRRNFAARLFDGHEIERAKRSIAFCFDMLKIPAEGTRPERPEADLSMEEVQAAAAKELEKALGLTPDIERGLQIYRDCALCHEPEGFGLRSGIVPQIAGQHREVVIKQLADMRAGNRDAVLMLPYASVEAIGGAQAVADVAGYIDTLEISTGGGKGPGDDLELGEQRYAEHCARCHGEQGEGKPGIFAPRIQAQHYKYLLRQFEWIKTGRRRNAHLEMREAIQDIPEREVLAILDWVSRLEPPEELQAPPGWHNPDFAQR